LKNGIFYLMSDKYHWPIFGHQQAINFLQNSIEQDKLAHAYLFYGSRGLGKKMIADYFSRSIFCTSTEKKPCGQCQACRLVSKGSYLDLYTLGKDEQELSVDNVREFMHSLQMTGIYGHKKVAIIYNVEKINIFGANALLKTIEEPPANTYIILISDNINLLPATVISRCQLLKFQALRRNEMEQWMESAAFNEQEKQTIINLSFGKPGLALQLMQENLEPWKKSCNFILSLLSSNTFNIMQSIEKWFAQLKKENPEARVSDLGQNTRPYIDYLEVMMRDLLWIKLDKPIVNEVFQSELNNISSSYSSEQLLNNLVRLNDYKQKLNNNVNPQLLWENIFLNLK
jgi:DNA polymerase-3 subunit delta'